MNQPIGANLNEAYSMLTPSVYDEHNRKVIEKISQEHRPQVKKYKPQPTWWQKIWSNITYLFTCCSPTNDNETEIEVNYDLKYDNTACAPPSTPTKPDIWVDTGTNKIPVDIFEQRLKALQNQRDLQDEEFKSISREDVQKQFDNFNRIRNEEVDDQFRQMQREKGY